MGRELKRPARGRAKADQLTLFSSACSYIIGVDEVGRGCLAGPVVAGAVMLPLIEPRSPLAASLAALDDSKAIPQAVREQLRDVIWSSAYANVAHATVEEIDEINILNASLLAMKRAVHGLLSRLPVPAEEILVLVDGNRVIKEFELKQKTVIKGDSTSASIAAASVVAKVHRDKLMCELAEKHPHYMWQQNKGYGSRAHRQAIVDHGVTDWHRKSFRLFAEELDAEEFEEAEKEANSV
ncbi:MAG: ribonuclease HII [Cyanobacteria bacterium SZAS LIN-2]|nr:ribonuclease HII [Cyanobacteria bacterium SZAS LIN-2]